MAPGESLYAPAGQAEHDADLDPLHEPAAQSVHDDDLAPLHLPAGQSISPLQAQNVPAAQSLQPDPSPLQARSLQPEHVRPPLQQPQFPKHSPYLPFEHEPERTTMGRRKTIHTSMPILLRCSNGSRWLQVCL